MSKRFEFTQDPEAYEWKELPSVYDDENRAVGAAAEIVFGYKGDNCDAREEFDLCLREVGSESHKVFHITASLQVELFWKEASKESEATK